MISPTKVIVGENLHYYRKEAGLTQDELADIARTGQRTVSKVENGTQNYSIATLERLSDGLKKPLYKLFTPRHVIDYRELLSDAAYAKGAIVLLYKYYLLLTRVENKEISERAYDTYGIGVEDCDDVRIEDISTEKNFVKQLVNFCNLYQVSSIHFPEVVQDAMNAYEEEAKV